MGLEQKSQIILRLSSNAPEVLAQQFFANQTPDENSVLPEAESIWTWNRVQGEIKNFFLLRSSRSRTGTSDSGESNTSMLRDIDRFFPKYRTRLQINFFTSLLLLNIFFNLIVIIVALLETKNEESLKGTIFLNATSLIVFGMFLLLTYFDDHLLRPVFNRSLASTTVLATMFFVEYGDIILQFDSRHLFQEQRIRPVIFFIISNHILVPFPSRKYSCIASSLIIVVEIIISVLQRIHACKNTSMIIQLTIADAIFYIYAALFGLYMSRLLEVITKRAFENHYRYIRSKLNTYQKQERQEHLLNSCFPKHLIEDVKSDLKSSIMEQDNNIPVRIQSPFKKLYVSQSKNVSILYADIVNSMLLTSLLTPKELVETLNRLFDSFDKCAEMNHCLRIKLLGDCYYCVSGMPKTGTEIDNYHALNTVNMGLDMIDIIAKVRHEKKVNVNMRIGIHSGMVLSGIIGLHKWQFDIWSEDAILASAMEHDGVPGTVHITPETLILLPEKFLESINIESRYFDDKIGHLITRKKPEDLEILEKSNQTRTQATMNRRISTFSKRQAPISIIQRQKVELPLQKPSISSQVNAFMEAEIEQMPLSFKSNVFKNIYGIHPILLTFQKSRSSIASENKIKNQHLKSNPWLLEKEFAKLGDDFFIFYLAFSLLLCCVIAIIKKLIIPRYHNIAWTAVLFVTAFLLIGLCIFYNYSTYSRQLSFMKRTLIWTLVTLVVLICSLHDLVFLKDCPTESLAINNSSDGDDEVCWVQCPYLWSFTNCVILAMTGTSVFIRINVWLKCVLHLVGYFVFAFMMLHRCSLYQLITSLEQSSGKGWIVNVGFDSTFSHLYYVFMIVIVLCIVDRQIEYIFRLDFKLSKRLAKEDHESKIMGEINEILLRNVLPADVASRYLDPHDPYCENYEYCAVMFASIPNYSDFYSENNLNDNGIKCLQLLNEIICDFDQHLTEPFFVNQVEKIKTIGSTYMVATGLYPGHGFDQCSESHQRSQVLTILRFAIELMKTLRTINQNALQEFKLRIGIAVGPVVAGVVGPSKPQYDIWGDTVNVASRMESTGVIGRIQVTKEAAEMLMRCGDYSDEFSLEKRGTITVKGKGNLETYLVKTTCDFAEKESTKI